MPGMRQGFDAFSRLPSDRLRLATKLVKGAEQVTSRPVDPVEKKPAAAKGKGKGRARKEEELGLTVSRKRSLSELLGSLSEPVEPAEPATRLT